MNSSRIVSSISAAIAVLSILFLPVIGCQDMNLTGLDLIQEKEELGLGEDIQFCIILSIVCGILVIIIKNSIISGISAIGGALSLIAAYFLAKDMNEFFDLKAGSFIAMIGYTVAALTSLFSSNRVPEVENSEN